MGTSKAQSAQTAARRERAISLRLAGVTWDLIAQQLGYSNKGAAHKDVMRALEQNRRRLSQTVDEFRDVELARLDRLQQALWKPATDGDHKVVDTILRISDRRMRLTGADVDPEVEARIRDEITKSVGAQMAAVWGWILGELALTDEQAERVPELIGQGIARFTGNAPPRRRRPAAIEGDVVDADVVDDNEGEVA